MASVVRPKPVVGSAPNPFIDILAIVK